jgi:uncharacterized membrane protein
MSAPPTFYLDAELRAHRSMSKQGLMAVLGVMVAYNVLVAVFMVAIGAFPVPVYLGLDVAGVALAFSVSNRRGGGQRVQVTHDEVRVTLAQGARSQTLWTSPTAFTQVEVETIAEGAARLRVRLSGRSLRIGAMLGPSELAAFADRLNAAIRTALAERHA